MNSVPLFLKNSFIVSEVAATSVANKTSGRYLGLISYTKSFGSKWIEDFYLYLQYGTK